MMMMEDHNPASMDSQLGAGSSTLQEVGLPETEEILITCEGSSFPELPLSNNSVIALVR